MSKLTKAQRRWLGSIAERPFGLNRDEVPVNVREALAEQELILHCGCFNSKPTDPTFYMITEKGREALNEGLLINGGKT